jgi:hypothetical protein
LNTSLEQKVLKQLLQNSDSRFTTVPGKAPGATYRVLWYQSEKLGRCKVDVLVPGLLDIPSVPEDAVVKRPKSDSESESSGLPLMPFYPLLMLKLRGWDVRRTGSSRRRFSRYHNDGGDPDKKKAETDAQDILEMLDIATRDSSVEIDRDVPWVSEAFRAASMNRVETYVRLFPTSAKIWAKLGFKTMYYIQVRKARKALEESKKLAIARYLKFF